MRVLEMIRSFLGVRKTEEREKPNVEKLDFDVSVQYRVNGQACYRFDAQLLGDVLAVGDDCGQTDAQLVGNLLVDKSLGQQHQHFRFAGGQFVRVGRVAGTFFLLPCLRMAVGS